MTRRQKGVRKLETFTHRVSKMEIPIYLNTNNSTFEAKVEQDGWTVTDKDLNDLKKKLSDYLDNRVDLGWREIIEIEFTERSNYHGAVSHVFGFKKKRYLISSYRVNGVYLQTEARKKSPFDDGPSEPEKYYLPDSRRWGHGSRDEEIIFPYRKEGSFGSPMVFIEYSDEVWAALDKMQETISQVAEQFRELVGTDEGYDQMEQIGREILKMLPAPEKD